MSQATAQVTHFIKNIIKEDLKNPNKSSQLVTRFPPEPNGYLHIGHAKAICLNFGLAQEFAEARCHLRFDDTNPASESPEYCEAIKEDVQWLGFQWHGEIRYASNYFEKLYQYAEELIQKGKAYVCSLSPEEVREQRGTLSSPGQNSPYRERTVAENLKLFRAMRAGEFEDGQHMLRAKIDMSSGNINMRDPIIYRIRKQEHHRTGNAWCIYPMYDFTHGLSDAEEGITHSLCTLEFQDHRPLYDWLIEEVSSPCHPQQIEFARLNLNYTVTSKRKLKKLIDEGLVKSWDDPRLPTIKGLRRRGYSPEAIRNFCERIGLSKKDTIIDYSILEECVRDDLNANAQRAMAVLDPIKVVITNYPEDKVEELSAPLHPQKPELGTRKIFFSKEIFIEADDFSLDPPAKYQRLRLAGEVRLRNSYIIKCEKIIEDPKTKQIKEIHCSYDPNTLGKKPEGRKVKGIIHWVDAHNSFPAEVRLYDRLFKDEDPNVHEKNAGSFLDSLNPESLQTKQNVRCEKSLAQAKIEQCFQFERLGYFVVDKDSKDDKKVFNKTVGLRDNWKK